MEAAYRTHYPCRVCGEVGDPVLNGHAITATDWPDHFFCSEECIEKYKDAHPHWKHEKEMRRLANEHNCYMRQVAKKEEWDQWAFTYDPESDKFQMGEFDCSYDAGDVLAITEGFKRMIAKQGKGD